MLLRKIISGGQTGADQAALRVVLQVGLECGGWCPPGHLCEAGIIPSQFPLKETPVDRSEVAPGIPRSQRTEWNVRDADATLVLLPFSINNDPGIQWTIECARLYNKPILVYDPSDESSLPGIINWLNTYRVEILNVAGPSEQTSPGIGESTIALLVMLLAEL